MKQFTGVVKEINRTLNEIILFQNIVNATLIFLTFYLVFSIFDVSGMYAFIPSIVYLIIFSIIKMRTSKAFLVESKYAPLREKLRTAADNLDMTSPILEELEYDVTREMKNVGLSMFI